MARVNEKPKITGCFSSSGIPLSYGFNVGEPIQGGFFIIKVAVDTEDSQKTDV